MENCFLDNEIFNQLDLFFADLHHPKTVEERAFYAALMAVSREGSLCLDLNRFSASPEWIKRVTEGALKSDASPYVHSDGLRFYLKKNFHYETQILYHIKRLSIAVKPVFLIKNNLI